MPTRDVQREAATFAGSAPDPLFHLGEGKRKMPGPHSGGVCHVDGCARTGVTILEFGREESRGDGHQRALICEYHTGAAYDYFDELGMPPPILVGTPRTVVQNRGGRPTRFPSKRAEFKE